jgi:hypothetical protein
MNNMTPEQEEQIRKIIREEMESTFAYVFSKHIQLLDGRNIQTGKTTGTKIGTEAGQKLGFFAATPVVQQTPSSSNQVTENSGTTLNNNSTSTGSIGLTAYRFAGIVAALKNLGLIAQ